MTLASFDPLSPEPAPPWVRRAAERLVILLVAVAALCWSVVAAFGTFPGDAQTEAEVREQRFGPVALAPAHVLDWIGRPVAALIITLAVALYGWRVLGPRYAVLTVATLGASLVTFALKVAVGRPRPATHGLLDASFPSGHTTFATAVLGFALLIALQQRRWVLASVCVVVIAAMGPSRVLLGVHWLSDVLAGYAIGAAWLLGVLLIGLPWARRTPARDGLRA